MKTLLGVAIVLWSTCGYAFTNPHVSSAVFREVYADRVTKVCFVCHEQSETASLHNMQDDMLLVPINNDQALCIRCHPGSDRQSTNHPVGQVYDPYQLSSRYVDSPVGIKLFRNSSKTRYIMCSTCHDPHSDSPALLRLPVENSELCLSCHKH